MEKDRWGPEVEALVRRFRKLAPADKEFELRPGSTVTDPVKFHKSLEDEIKEGPRSPRDRTGALVAELRDYLAVREGRRSGTSEGPPGSEGQ